MATTLKRNDVCPCGSGRKFKVCCLHVRTDSRPAQMPSRLSVPVPFAPRPASRPALSVPVTPRDWQEVEAVLETSSSEAFVAVVVYSRQWLRAKKVSVGSPLPLNIPQFRLQGTGRVRSIRPSQEVPDGEGLVLRIDREEKLDAHSLPPAEQREWQQVHVRLDEPGGTHVYAVLLHSREWLTWQGIEGAGKLPLDMREQKVQGTGRIALIEPSPVRGDGEGRVMTFVRSNRKAENALAPLARPGVRTYFGERLPPIGHGWMEMVLAQDGKQKSDLRFTRSEEWIRAFRQVVGERPDTPERLPAGVADWRLLRVTVAVQQEQKVHIVFLLPWQRVEERALTVGEPVLLRLPKDHLSGEGTLTAIEPAPFVPGGDEPMGRMFISGKRGSQSKGTIEAMEVGDYVTTYTHAERGDRLPVDDTQEKWVARQRIRLHLDKEDGGHSKIVLLREAEWVRTERAAVGGTVELNMPEMGCVGDARVEEMEACLVFYRWGNSSIRMVTGTFAHTASECGDLRLRGESAPLGVTPLHPIWSEDRYDWIPAGELRPGETVKTLAGTTTVESYALRAEPEPVYNIEVEGDHCYRVGEQGVLVHNASCPNEILASKAACALLPEEFTGIKYLGFDGQGRAKGVQARLCKANVGGGSAPSEKPDEFPKGWDEAGRTLINRGVVLVRAHLLHEDLGGPGTAKNLVVTCKSVNSKLYSDFEKIVLGWIGEGSTVDVNVSVDYSGDSPYPQTIHVHASRLNCQKAADNRTVCDDVRPSGGITASIDIADCNGAIRR